MILDQRIVNVCLGIPLGLLLFGRMTVAASASELAIHPDAPALSGKVALSAVSISGQRSIKVVDFKKGSVSSLVVSNGRDEHPDWSPDGTQIAFQSDRSGDLELYLARADGTEVRRLTDYSGADEDPRFSPDGKRIAFRRSQGKASGIFFIDIDGSSLEQVTSGDFHDTKPSWSPDGRALLFSSSANFPGWDVFLINLETRIRRRKTGGQGTFCRPDWRPDGLFFAYTHSSGDGFNLWLEPITGKPKRLTHYAGKDYDVRWIDNDSLLFVRNRGGTDDRYALYLLTLSTGKVVQLTEGSDSVRDPAWSR